MYTLRMRLYLSSMDVGNYPERLIGLVGNNKKAAVVLNALDHADSTRNEWLKKNIQNLERLGFQTEELDLRQYFYDNNGLENKLSEYGLVYGGFSAALYVISPSLRGAELVDDPEIAPTGYKEEFRWDALNLIPYSVAVHYQSNHEESEDMEKEIEYYKKNNISYKTLRDGDVIVISGDSEEVLNR